MTDHSWRDDAACLGQFTDMWFPERGQWTGANQWAQRMCLECPVRDLCLQAALEEPEQIGLRGGLSGQQRNKLKGRAV